MRLTMKAFLLAVVVVHGGSAVAQDIVSMLQSGRSRRANRRIGLQLGARTPPNFESRHVELMEHANDGDRKLAEETEFWDMVAEEMDSFPMMPSSGPSSAPSEGAGLIPSGEPSYVPSYEPTQIGTPATPPVAPPTNPPAPTPTNVPVPAPTALPVAVPTALPVATPTAVPVPAPTALPVATPTALPIAVPTDVPVPAPTALPVATPTDVPVPAPTALPVATPTDVPVPAPTALPVATPTDVPVPAPTVAPVAPTAPPMSGPPVVLQAIQPVALQGGAEFADPNSYQSKALARTEQQVNIASQPASKIIQYYALYTIYTATNSVPNVVTQAEGLVEVPPWLVAIGWDSTDIDPCNGVWFGITCVNNLVTAIDLFSNILTGSFPPEVTLLASDGERSTGAGALTRIDLFDNMLLTNNDDNSWWSQLGSAFAFLFFKETAFSGPLGRLPPNIQEFDASFSFISGGLTDANFAGLNSMVFADLGGNAYNSSVPQAFSSLPALQFLYLVDGFISGDLSYMIGMPAMREHWVDTNPGLGGALPAALSAISTLESLSISSCNFVGTIPVEWGNWGISMKQIWMYENALTGAIPSQLGLLKTMRLLQMEGNAFVGSMPAEICANTVFPGQLETLGADCFDQGFTCDCCTCCSVLECPV